MAQRCHPHLSWKALRKVESHPSTPELLHVGLTPALPSLLTPHHQCTWPLLLRLTPGFTEKIGLCLFAPLRKVSAQPSLQSPRGEAQSSMAEGMVCLQIQRGTADGKNSVAVIAALQVLGRDERWGPFQLLLPPPLKSLCQGAGQRAWSGLIRHIPTGLI